MCFFDFSSFVGFWLLGLFVGLFLFFGFDLVVWWVVWVILGGLLVGLVWLGFGLSWVLVP